MSSCPLDVLTAFGWKSERRFSEGGFTSKVSLSQSPSSGPFQASSVILLTRSQNLPQKRAASPSRTLHGGVNMRTQKDGAPSDVRSSMFTAENAKRPMESQTLGWCVFRPTCADAHSHVEHITTFRNAATQRVNSSLSRTAAALQQLAHSSSSRYLLPTSPPLPLRRIQWKRRGCIAAGMTHHLSHPT